MTARPRLRPGLRRAWRDATTLQVGVFPGPGVVLRGLQPGDEAVLAALDGHHDLPQLRSIAARHRVARRRVDDLLVALERARLLMGDDATAADRADLTRLGVDGCARLASDADSWSLVHDTDGLALAAARVRRRVVVRGAGRVAAALATTLTSAGVGSVSVDDSGVVLAGDVLPAGARAGDVGSPWSQFYPSGSPPATLSGAEPDVVVLVGDQVADSRAGDDLVRRDVVHLAVTMSADRSVVGPLVLPGRSPCLRCLDLHRRERDSAWLHLVAQLLTARASTPVGETALSTATAGMAALQVLAHLDGQVRPDAVGRTLETTLPHGRTRRRVWRAHAACGCARLDLWDSP